MSIKDLLKLLNIKYTGTFSRDGSYVIDLGDNIEDFSEIFSTLEHLEEAEYMDENSLVTVDNTNVNYIIDDYMISLIGDFDANLYKLVINEVEIDNEGNNN